MTRMDWNERAVCSPSPLVGEGSGAPSRGDGVAPREGGESQTPLRARDALACSPTRGERGVC
jgi:hypothetical protein